MTVVHGYQRMLIRWGESVVVQGAGPVGLAVDELLGRQEIVIKTLGSLKPMERSFFGGATIDPPST